MLTGPAFAEKRVALVIGNGAYDQVSRLINPTNDAEAVASTLKSAGFDLVDLRRDLKLGEMRRVLRDFYEKTRDADMAVVYYAGHGIEIEGTNYLLPTDTVLERDVDVYDEALPLERILVAVEPAKQLRLVILDACRDNPFAKTMKRTVGTRAVTRGLAKVEPTSPNTLIAYAAKAGSTAADGDNKNSPFTTALVRHIATPGLDLRKAFGFVRDDVLKSTSNKQEPYVYGSLGGNDVPLIAARPATVTQPQANPLAEVRRDYELALQIGTKEVWGEFLKQFPDGFYAGLAKAQLNKIAAEEARVTATEKARAAAEEQERLAAEGARKAEQAKAAAQAKAAEEARLAAEKVKAVEQAKAAEAEKKRAAAEKAAAEQIAAEKAAAEKKAADKAAADAARKDAEQPAEQKLAALPPASEAGAPTPLSSTSQSQIEIARSVQIELRRVGCHTSKIDDDWSAAARKSLEKFNKRAGMKLEIKLASIDALEAIKTKTSRICPLECDYGLRADGERCVKITCSAGSFLNDDNECEKRAQKPRRQEVQKKPQPAAEPAIARPRTPNCVPGGQMNVGDLMAGRVRCL